MTETTITDKDHNEGEVAILVPNPSIPDIKRVLETAKKETTPRKRPTSAKPSKRKPAKKKKESKAKETKSKAKPISKHATKTKAIKKKVAALTTNMDKTKPSTKSTQTISQLSPHHQLILYTMNRVGSEMSYDELTDELGLSRAVLRKTVNSRNKFSLVVNGLVTVNQYETEDGELNSPYYFQITDAGKKLVN